VISDQAQHPVFRENDTSRKKNRTEKRSTKAYKNIKTSVIYDRIVVTEKNTKAVDSNSRSEQLLRYACHDPGTRNLELETWNSKLKTISFRQ